MNEEWFGIAAKNRPDADGFYTVSLEQPNMMRGDTRPLCQRRRHATRTLAFQQHGSGHIGHALQVRWRQPEQPIWNGSDSIMHG